jgi:hypothetical protein
MEDDKHSKEDESIRHLGAISVDNPLVQDVLKKLEATHIPMNFSRKNTGAGHTMSLGRVSSRYYHRMGNSRFDEKFPELKKAVFKLGRLVSPDPFSTVQVNYNYKTHPHIDENNIGHSTIIGLGDYKGGDVIVSGKHYDIHYKPLRFNGALHTHSTAPYTGNRYSLVFFKTREINW